MITMEYIIHGKNLLTLVFDRKVLNHLKAKADDYLNLLQSLNDVNRFLLIKADTGYRIRRHPFLKKKYRITISHPYEGLQEFQEKEITYFMRQNGSILIKLKGNSYGKECPSSRFVG